MHCKKSILICALWMFLGLFGGHLPAQSPASYFEHYGIEDGLTASYVTALFKDSRGYLWVGTQDGLNRFDGYDFTPVRHLAFDSTSLSGNFISDIAEDAAGNLWVGTFGKGLTRLDGETGEVMYCCEQFFDVRKNPAQSVTRRLAVLGNTLWVSHLSGLSRVELDDQGNPLSYELVALDGQPQGVIRIEKLEVDALGRLWVPTNFGVFRKDPGREGLRRIGGDLGEIRWARDLVLDSLNRPLIIGQDHRLYLYAPETDRFEAWGQGPDGPEDGRLVRLLMDRRHRLWLGTRNNGFHVRTDADTQYHIAPVGRRPGSFWSEEVTAFLEDEKGVFWIGTQDGVYCWSPGRNKFRQYPEFAGSAVERPSPVWTVLLDRHDQLWVGTGSKGLARLNRKTGKLDWLDQESGKPFAQPQGRVNALLEDRAGMIWVGGMRGLVRFDPVSLAHSRLTTEDGLADNFVRDLTQDRWGNIWVFTNDGLNRLDPETGALTMYRGEVNNPNSLHSNRITTGLIDSRDRLWIGSFAGLGMVQLDENAARFEDGYVYYTHRPEDPARSLSSEIVTNVQEDRQGKIWVGTTGGLDELDPEKGVLRVISPANGLINTSIYAILEDSSGHLWLSHATGLTRFDPAVDSFRHFSFREGLQMGEFNMNTAFQTESGEIFMGGAQGVNSFFPERLFRDSLPPRAAITGLDLQSGPAPGARVLISGDTLQLAWNENFFRIDFQVMDYVLPEGSSCAYRLRGLESEWISTPGKSMVRYAGLPPGAYTFQLRGCNSDGVVSQEMQEIHLLIATPFWQSSWFRVLCFLGALLLLLGLIGLGLRIRRRRREAMAEAVRQENERIQKATARDFHDEMGHYITRIVLLSGLMARSDSPEKQDSLSQTIQENCEHLARGTRDFIWSIDPNQGSLYDLAIRVQEFGESLFEFSETSFRLTGLSPDFATVLLPMDWRRHLAMILKEALHNVVRHARASNAALHFAYEAPRLRITVQDDGCAREVLPETSGNGLRNMRNRAEQIGARLEFAAREGFSVSLEVDLVSQLSQISS